MRTLIISSDANRTMRNDHATTVATPLDAIRHLESTPAMSTVIIRGAHANNDQLAAVLREIYPAVRVKREA